MSNAYLAACWPLQMRPAAKAVLIALADQADDRGACWPSLATIGRRTCLSRRAVIEAVAWLEGHGALTGRRVSGRSTQYRLTPERFALPVHEAHPCSRRTGAADARPPCTSRTTPVHLAHPNPQEPPVTINALSGARLVTCSPGEAAAALNRVGARITSQHPDLIAACAEGVTVAQLLELRNAHPGKPAPYLVAIARRLVAEGASSPRTGSTPHAANRPLSAIERVVASIERNNQRTSPDTEAILEGHAIRLAR